MACVRSGDSSRRRERRAAARFRHHRAPPTKPSTPGSSHVCQLHSGYTTVSVAAAHNRNYCVVRWESVSRRRERALTAKYRRHRVPPTKPSTPGHSHICQLLNHYHVVSAAAAPATKLLCVRRTTRSRRQERKLTPENTRHKSPPTKPSVPGSSYAAVLRVCTAILQLSRRVRQPACGKCALSIASGSIFPFFSLSFPL